MTGPVDSRLHNAFLLGSKKEFRRLLALPVAGGGGNGTFGGSSSGWQAGSSGPRSWSNNHSLAQSHSQTVEKLDINARDSLGRTPLHLIACSLNPVALDFLRLLLESQPKSGLQVNAQDVESGWTALHRALYVGNLAAARLLLADENVDPKVKDWEDLTCWDLFNGTVEGTNPPEDAIVGDALFTWGTNRNYTLGTDGDRTLPERIPLKRVERKAQEGKEQRDDLRLFEPVGVREVTMSKLHTGVITAERSNNVSLCGFGSGGRLGRSIHTQIELAPIPDFPQQITSFALSQDHTLALTSSGQILSWGLNRFATLGYPIDAPAFGSKFSKDPEEAAQTSPRRILGPLKKEVVLGVAASRCSSACWTDDSVWTWGRNNGHLGYDVGGTPDQVLPRKVAGISQPVIGIALTDYAMCCLTAANEVICFYRGGSTKVNFPAGAFFAESAIYRPPQFNKRLKVTKIVSSGITFACLTSLGDVYTFALPSPTEVEREAASAGVSLKDRAGLIKPQRTWALRKRFTAVKDVALGSDGTIILCTQSGHVYVRTRNKTSGGIGPAGWSSSKAFKFHRIPYLQRVIKVTANETGAFGAIRVDAIPKAVEISGNLVSEDLTLLQPHVRRFMDGRKGSFLLGSDEMPLEKTEEDGESDVSTIRGDVKIATELLEITTTWAPASAYPPLFGVAGSDCVIHASGRDTPAHTFLLAARSPVLCRLLSGDRAASGRLSVEKTVEGRTRIHLSDCQHLTLLLLLQYLHSDDLPAIWDSRVGGRLQEVSFAAKGVDFTKIRLELRALAQDLELPLLTPVLERLTKTLVAPSLSSDLARAFDSAQQRKVSFPLRGDLVIDLADKTVEAHECILRSRSPFFSAMYEDQDWTLLRRDDSGVVTVDMKHLTWPVMRLVFRFLYEGAGPELFEYHHQETLDLFLDFVFDVLAAATELLLDRLVLVCSTVILRHVTINNVCSLLDTASFYNALDLRDSLQHYISQNMETMLESHYLDSMPTDLLTELSSFVVAQQEMRLPVSRSNVLVAALMAEHKAWLSLQDIPQPSIRQARPVQPRVRSPKMSPVDLTPPSSAKTVRRPTRTSIVSPTASPALKPSAGPDDDLFTMDEDEDVSSLAAGIAASLALGASGPGPSIASSSAGPSALATPSKPIWKARQVEPAKTDLRSIMSEAATFSSPRSPAASSSLPRPSIDPTPSLSFKISQKDRKKIQSQAPVQPAPRPSDAGSSSPWRTIPVAAAPLAPSGPSSASSTPFSSSPRRDSGFVPLGSSMTRSSSSAGPSAVPASRPIAANASGEVIRPVRAVPSNTPRKVSSDPAWATPTFSISPPVVRPSLQAVSSFAHIQQQQKSDSQVAVVPSKTLMQIQQEEEADRRAAVEEAEFMRWWAEEEKRMAAAGGSPALEGGEASGSASKKAGKGARGGKKPRGGGKAEGGGGPGPSTAGGKEFSGPPPSRRTSEGGQRSRGGGEGGGSPSTRVGGSKAARPVAPRPSPPPPPPPATMLKPTASVFIPTART